MATFSKWDHVISIEGELPYTEEVQAIIRNPSLGARQLGVELSKHVSDGFVTVDELTFMNGEYIDNG